MAVSVCVVHRVFSWVTYINTVTPYTLRIQSEDRWYNVWRIKGGVGRTFCIQFINLYFNLHIEIAGAVRCEWFLHECVIEIQEKNYILL